MSENLKNFLIDLASDLDFMARYTSDPEGELNRAGLTADEKAAVLRRDAGAIRHALGVTGVDHMTQIGQPPRGGKPKPRPGKPKPRKPKGWKKTAKGGRKGGKKK
jgi:hypothetical protein